MMREYVRGALEALLWVKKLLENEELSYIKNQVENAIEDITSGVAIDFRERLRAIMY